MTKTKIAAVFILGLIVGVLATIRLFAIKDIDLLSVPYKNQGVILQETVFLKQNGIFINLPKGTEVNLTYRMPEGIGVFSIPVTFDMGKEPKLLLLPRRANYFDGLSSDLTNTSK